MQSGEGRYENCLAKAKTKKAQNACHKLLINWCAKCVLSWGQPGPESVGGFICFGVDEDFQGFDKIGNDPFDPLEKAFRDF